MLSIAVLTGPWPRLGLVVAAACAATAILARSDERRAWAMLGALVLAPVLLLVDVWHSPQLGFVHRHPLEAVIGALVALAVLGVAAWAIHRVPWLVAPLTALTVPFRIPIASGGTTNNLLVPLYFVIAASALGWLVPVLWRARVTRSGPASAAGPQRPPRLLFEKLLAAYVVLYALQSLYSPATGAPAGFVKALQNEVFFYLPFALLLARLRDLQWSRRLLLQCLAVTLTLAVAFSFVGYVEEITKHLILSSKLVLSNSLHAYFTVNSVFFDPNIFGRYLALAMLLATTVLLYDERVRVQLGSIALLAIMWTCLVFTLSRSSLVALAAGMAVLAAMRWRARPVIYLGLVVVVIGGAVVVTHPSKFGLQNFNLASGGRANLITGGVQLFLDRPLTGFGSGSFTTEYKHHFPGPAASVSDSHNIAITIGAEQGIIGELLYLALLVAAAVALFRGARGDPYRIAVAAAFVALVLHTMLYADFLEDPVTWTLLAVGGALAATASGRSTRDTGIQHDLRAVA